MCVFDVSATAEADVNGYVEKLANVDGSGLAVDERRGTLTFSQSAAQAVAGADFVQENVPERLPIKLACLLKSSQP